MKLKLALAAAAAALATMAVSAPASAALTTGDMLDLQYWFPDLGDVITDTGAFAYTGPGQSVLTQFGITTAILDDNHVTFAETPGCGFGCFQTNANYNGPVLFDLTNNQAFKGWAVISDTVGITSSILTGDHVGVNWQGQPVQGAVVVGVPEPATWALMIGGLGLAGATLRRSRRTAAATA